MTHYHLIFGSGPQGIITQAFFDNYEESVVQFVEMSQMFFGGLMSKEDTLSVDKALEVTEYGNAHGAYAGIGTFNIYWYKCAGCAPFTLN